MLRNAAVAQRTKIHELGDLRKEGKLVEDYFNLASIKKVFSHQLIPSGPINFTFNYEQRKLAENSKRTVSLNTCLQDPLDLQSFGPVSLPFEIQDSIVYAPSPSRTRTFLAKAGEGPLSVILEIWEGPKCIKQLQVLNAKHGTILDEGMFSGGASWSKDEQRVAYVAETPPEECPTEWGKDADGAEAELSPQSWKGVSPWEQCWGESFANIRRPSIFVFDLNSNSLLSFEHLLTTASSFGQPIWTPNDRGIVCVEWPHRQSNFNNVDLKLGILGPKNRPCNLLYIPLEAACEVSKKSVCLSPVLKSAWLPSFSPNGETLLFVSNEHAVETGIPTCVSRLYTIDWTEVESELHDDGIDIAQYTKLIIGDIARSVPPLNFPGLVLETNNPMSSPFIDDDRILLSCQWGFQVVVIMITLSTGEIHPLNPIGMTKESFSLLCFKSGVAIACKQSLISSPCLVAKRVEGEGPWTLLDNDLQPKLETDVLKAVEDLEQYEIKFQPKKNPKNSMKSQVMCEAVAIRTKNASKPQPAVFIPHGGPHVSVKQNYNPLYVLLCSMGVTVLTVNYRGSHAYGNEFLTTLLGHIGEGDVEDCIESIDIAIEKGLVDPNNICSFGGSYGGFLTGVFCGKFPDRFRCAILRNPVLSFAHSFYTTDIPDINFMECFGQKGKDLFTTVPGVDIMKKFNEMSATKYVDQVKTPMLFLIGEADRRVPCSDSLRYIATLKSRKDSPEIRVVSFPNDRHALNSPQAEFESAMNILWWLKKHHMIE